MKIEQILETYDDAYAQVYDQTFLTDIESQVKTKCELEILSKILNQKDKRLRWLDVACGTGYVLSCFPDVKRSGLDLSPAMLGIAEKKNPDIKLIQGDYRNRSLFKEKEWDVISSMWWAYTFVESISEIETFISNISYGLSDDGICFMPIGEFRNLTISSNYEISNFPFVLNENAPVYGGKILLNGFLWSWVEPGGKRHDNMLVPQVEVMIEMFNKYFQSVELIEYANGYYKGILATKNKQNLSTLISNFSFNKNENNIILAKKISLINKVKNNLKKGLNLFKNN